MELKEARPLLRVPLPRYLLFPFPVDQASVAIGDDVLVALNAGPREGHVELDPVGDCGLPPCSDCSPSSDAGTPGALQVARVHHIGRDADGVEWIEYALWDRDAEAQPGTVGNKRVIYPKCSGCDDKLCCSYRLSDVEEAAAETRKMMWGSRDPPPDGGDWFPMALSEIESLPGVRECVAEYGVGPDGGVLDAGPDAGRSDAGNADGGV